ncbi:MAG: threonylcarbamoyl-AMP synthase, partial [Limnobacter sp.]|nr:threonylcarbamoyl-AMP synthase [Limnobacter sp.]
MDDGGYAGPNPRKADAAAIAEAAAELAAGRLVALPTETVYGLGGDAASREAVARIYRLKGRPADHPLIVHVTGVEQARRWAHWDARAQALADAFWPGPLTMILARRDDAPAWACGGQPTIGLRAPAHPVARELLQAFEALGGTGVAAPSANRFGRVSPTQARHVIDDLGAQAPMVLDGGSCEVGVESTIVDLSRAVPVLLRPGGIEAARLEAVLGEPLGAADATAPRAPGTLAAHYAPRTPLELIDGRDLPRRLGALSARGLRVAVWSRERPAASAAHWEAAPEEPQAMAQCLYETLRRLDGGGFDRLLIEAPPEAAQAGGAKPPGGAKPAGDKRQGGDVEHAGDTKQSTGARESGDPAGRWSAVVDRLLRAAAG